MGSTSFREIEGVHLPALYISLGLREEDFTAAAPAVDGARFTTALAAGPEHPGCVLLVRGGKCHLFDVEAGQWRHDGWPRSVPEQWGIPGAGVDAATWAGPKYPALFYFFAGNQVVRWNAAVKGVDVPLVPLVQGGWGSAVGNRFGESGPDVVVHDERIDLQSRLHLFAGDQYLRHDLDNGGRDLGPGPISEFWPGLPEPFTAGIDYAFWGQGEDVGRLVLVRGAEAVVYDPDSPGVVRQGAVGNVVKGFQVQGRPQLFLREEYVLHRYVGDIERGPYVRSTVIQALSTETRTRTIEREYLVRTSHSSSVLDSSDSSVVSDLARHVREDERQEESAENYRYAMEADFHGDASATSAWGGEVNAHLGVRGGSDDLRTAFARSVESGISSQVRNASAQLKRQEAASGRDETRKETSAETTTQTTGSIEHEQTVIVDWYQIMQRYLTVLALEHVSLVYVDAAGRESAEIFDMERLLERRVVEGSRAAVAQYVAGELSAVSGLDGQPRSLLRSGPSGSHSVDPGVSTAVPVVLPDGTQQTVTVRGIAKSIESRTLGTTQMRPWDLGA